ncbi:MULTISPECIES: hypothetical protein [Psychrilyobacter]|uniref:Uncharacterized protein n=1 Tax=Psychrilyobacter piezotolerans TaxID=2293438 RepID=A0ABX9KCU7_9FUSO|nr:MULTISPECIES: hypothetical protein [Psychrilyobacter]MCS5423062.1 hypothetical protein [Psychrilyobacter sp. S5]NDI79272.1 hypothetical protein [Psychrilyobacter piezotolerans]RDE58801.1 hypothetical protein DV867_15360 [Psychrilyobacter sp. S5]REI39284.1 hypothetical protein DYH56_15360 [Psychrilyobacter piezotolerans]
MRLEELEEIMSPEDFKEFEALYFAKEDVYSPQWYILQEMMEKILAKYGVDTPDNPHETEDEEDEEDF